MRTWLSLSLLSLLRIYALGNLSLSKKAIVLGSFIIYVYYHAYLSYFLSDIFHAETCCRAVECVPYSAVFSVNVFCVIFLYKTPGFDSMLK